MLFSVATLTGHVYRAYGPYTGAIGNARGAARGVIDALDALGEQWARADGARRGRGARTTRSSRARSSAEDVVSSNRLASVNTPRGHQFPFAFLDIASGLKGGALPFIHLDIGGVGVESAGLAVRPPHRHPDPLPNLLPLW